MCLFAAAEPSEAGLPDPNAIDKNRRLRQEYLKAGLNLGQKDAAIGGKYIPQLEQADGKEKFVYEKAAVALIESGKFNADLFLSADDDARKAWMQAAGDSQYATEASKAKLKEVYDILTSEGALTAFGEKLSPSKVTEMKQALDKLQQQGSGQNQQGEQGQLF